MENQFDTFDFCYLCGKVVLKGEWRTHMINHNMVLQNNPKDKDGNWIDLENLKLINK